MSHFTLAWRRHATSLPVVALAAVIGLGIGRFAPGVADKLGLLADTYVSLLKMIAIPFMVSAVTYSLSGLMESGGTSELLWRAAKFIGAAMIGAALLGIAVGVALGPGRDLSSDTLLELGQFVGEDLNGGGRTEMTLSGPVVEPAAMGLREVLQSLVPDNIFAAASKGEMLKLLIFSLLVGAVIGTLPQADARPLNAGLRGVFQASMRLTIWFNALLPFFVVSIIAQHVARSPGGSAGPLRGMLGFVLALLVAVVAVTVVSIALLRWASGASWRQVLLSQREAVMLGIATTSGPACMPLMIDGLINRLGFPRARIELLVPLGLSLLRVGPVLNYTISTLFIAQLYAHPLGLEEWLLIILGSVLAAFGSSGMSGLVAIGLIGVVCSYVGLPFDALAVLFIALNPITDTMRTVANIVAANAFAAIVCGGDPVEPEALPPSA